uniref:Uncharacterized protein n=2 Tax=Panagrolaimus sp. JU765 TaxID=591449 RepID=A0AC34Q6S3_9BILA
MAKKIVKDLNTRQLNKLKHRLNRAGKSGRLKRHQVKAVQKIQDKRRAKQQGKMYELIDDYEHVRKHNETESNEEFEELKTNLLGKKLNKEMKMEKEKAIKVEKEKESESEESSDDEAMALDMLDDEMEGYMEVKNEIED